MKKIISSILSVLILFATTLKSNAQDSIEIDPVMCEEVLDQAMLVLTACDEAVKKLRIENEELSKTLSDSRDLNRQLTESNNAWHKNPIIMGVLGFTLGVIVIKK